MQETNYENKNNADSVLITTSEKIIELENKIKILQVELGQMKRRYEICVDACAKEEGKVEILKELLEDSIRKLIKQNE